MAIDPVVHGSVFTNSLYAAQIAKDAIVDQIRRSTGRRPSVDLADPDVRINLHIDQKRATLYLDASGESLHKRGYRQEAGAAPINEVLAAGILKIIDWDRASPLVDPLCGSGTFPIEAALAARRIVPGTIRKQFGYMRWQDYCPSTHDAILAECRSQQLDQLDFPIHGSDIDDEVIAQARANAQRAGVDADIQWSVQDFGDAVPPAPAGTLISNPPYDERMKTVDSVDFHRRLGDVLKHNWAGYTAWILAGNREAAKFIGLRPAPHPAVQRPDRVSLAQILDLCPGPAPRRAAARPPVATVRSVTSPPPSNTLGVPPALRRGPRRPIHPRPT